MTRTTLTVAQIYALTNEEITNTRSTLQALIETGWSDAGTCQLETFDQHVAHAPSVVRLNEWAQSILGPDMHFSMGGSTSEEGTPTITIREGLTLTDTDTENVTTFLNVLSDSNQNYARFEKKERFKQANGDKHRFHAHLDTFYSDQAMVKATRTVLSLDFARANDTDIEQVGAAADMWNVFRNLSENNFTISPPQ